MQRGGRVGYYSTSRDFTPHPALWGGTRVVCVCVSRARPWAVPGDRTCIPVHSAEAEGGPEAAPVGSAVRM